MSDKEMDIDLIKWMVGYAEGFEWLEGNIGFQPCIRYKEQICIANLVTEWDLFPLLLQRAIEGVNRRFYNEGSKIYPWLILNTSHGFSVYYQVESGPRDSENYKWPCHSVDIDQAKESALKYIYKQEKNK